MILEFQNKVKTGNAHQAGSGFGGKGLETLDKQRDMVKLVQKKVILIPRFVYLFSRLTVMTKIMSLRVMKKLHLLKLPPLRMLEQVSRLLLLLKWPHQILIKRVIVTFFFSFNMILAAAIRAAQLAAARVNPAVAPARLKEAIAEINAKFRGDPNLVSELLDHLNPPQVFTQEIEINDYPQKARWRVTNKVLYLSRFIF